MAETERLAPLVSGYVGAGSNDISRATSPGGNPHTSSTPNGVDYSKESRSRPRTFPYFKHLPYPTESSEEHLQNLNIIVEHLYVAVSAGDFAPGAAHWTRELRGWLSLKFDLPRETRIKLVKLYYELALAPGLEVLTAERFAGTFMTLTKYVHIIFRHLTLLSCTVLIVAPIDGNITCAMAKTSRSTGVPSSKN